MVSPSEFVAGTSVRWARLARVLVGATFGAVFTGWASIVLGLADLVILPLEYLAAFLGNLVELLVGIPARAVAESWVGAAAFLEGTGLLGFVAALAIVLLTLYVVVRIMRWA